ncbi:MAG: rRNA maturation RNase YbeY [Thermoguttaceae bacterium]
MAADYEYCSGFLRYNSLKWLADHSPANDSYLIIRYKMTSDGSSASVSLQISVTDTQSQMAVDKKRLRKAVRIILRRESIPRAKISVALVDDYTIAALHQQYLNDPNPTDVLSFSLERTNDYLEGEVVVSAETAQTSALRYHWTPEDELLLYVVHGVLHLVGYDDTSPKKQKIMRSKERQYLAESGVENK